MTITEREVQQVKLNLIRLIKKGADIDVEILLPTGFNFNFVRFEVNKTFTKNIQGTLITNDDFEKDYKEALIYMPIEGLHNIYKKKFKAGYPPLIELRNTMIEELIGHIGESGIPFIIPEGDITDDYRTSLTLNDTDDFWSAAHFDPHHLFNDRAVGLLRIPTGIEDSHTATGWRKEYSIIPYQKMETQILSNLYRYAMAKSNPTSHLSLMTVFNDH